jgi:uncharacterized protein (UPF0332 family)
VISAYGRHFAKTQELDPHFHRVLIAAFDLRQLGDYSAPSGITQARVDALFADVAAFLAAAHNWLETHPPPTS